MLNQVEERRASIQDDYERILVVAPELADIASADQFAWARMIVCSRNFGITYVYRGATVKSSALVPYAGASPWPLRRRCDAAQRWLEGGVGRAAAARALLRQ